MSEPEATWLDGKAFAGWIEGRRPDVRVVLNDSENRTLYRFRDEGGRASLGAADRLCCRLSLHIDEIPEWIWSDHPQNRRRYAENQREEAVAMLIDGATVRQVADELAIPSGTIKRWRRDWIREERRAA